MEQTKSSDSQKFNSLISRYEKLGLNISQALSLLLEENDIPFLSINYRVKKHDSFMEKIKRKDYENPFEEVEDICGIRIICYYQSDIEKIKAIISKEFNTLNNESKEASLDFDQFGYRSSHFIIKIKDDWLTTPNYRGLQDLKAELQVRTVLMHAWAEIEHKLAYKTKTQIPEEYKRKFSRISAKLEEADEQFEEIKNKIESKKAELIKSAKKSNQFNYENFNLDTLQAFLDYAFPERDKSIKETAILFNEMLEQNLTFKELVEGFEKYKNVLKEIEKEISEEFNKKRRTNRVINWFQTGIARCVLDIVNKEYFKNRNDIPEYNIIIEKYRSTK
ncbi:hypothetical protein GCM10007424_28560 [Flavobacterium suaedae]|uniref:RelA/SpoT domain-containing protein n=1 Tax=Flavobacterium suaedae TaxID=1767027 RepID=A0ABQ1K3J2_9FLAO|nr:hypothetical protein [Flavobacterium suaedae]GGB86778.1 hypothetical protein GCM10007424_28560 [Flavobacterium suaedae]